MSTPILRFALLFLSASCFLAPTHAQKGSPLQVVVCDLQNGGGLEARSGETALEIQYSQGLTHYLSEHLAAPKFRVSQRKRPRGLQAGTLFLSGELCKVGGTNGTGASYFCTLRLSRQEREKRVQLINSWSGFAQNYRWLSTNLSNDPQINREGLLGALGEKIVAQIEATEEQISGEAAREWEARLQKMTAQVSSNTAKFQPLGGQKVRIANLGGGTLWVVRCQAGQAPLLLSESEIATSPNAPLDLDLTPLVRPNRAPFSLYFLLQTATSDSKTRGLGSKSPDVTPLLDEQKMNELRRQIAPPNDDYAASAPAFSARQTESSSGFDGPAPVKVLEGAPVAPPAPILPTLSAKMSEGNWQITRWDWR